MTANQSRNRKILLFSFFIVLSFVTCFGQSSPRVFLKHLQGAWYMTGTVMNKPVKYTAEGVWLFHSQFFSLHMQDAAVPSTYEANLFIGIDSAKSQYVAHWLDSFGGSGARVVGLGPLSAEKIEIVYPYSERNFRNTLQYDAEKDELTLVIESEGTDGHWAVFAENTIARKEGV
jgi:hypothetical protein